LVACRERDLHRLGEAHEEERERLERELRQALEEMRIA
jgi:hypothetical protein